MPDSNTHSPVPGRPLAESILALFAGRTRAAAIYGDLIELASVRGRFWFWTAYARTVFALTWRTDAAFLGGCAAFIVMSFAPHRRPYIPHQEGALTNAPLLLASMMPLARVFLRMIATPLWFLVPFGLVRYGARDRFVQLAALLALFGAGAYLNLAVLSLPNAAAALLLIICALFSSAWRKPMIVITGAAVTGLAALGLSYGILAGLYHPAVQNHYESHPVAWMVNKMTAVIAMAIPALVCSRLHRWLVESRSGGAAHA